MNIINSMIKKLMKITPCDNTAEEVPFSNNKKRDQNLTSLIKKKECAKGRLVVFSLIQVPGLTCAIGRLRNLSFFAWKSYAGLT